MAANWPRLLFAFVVLCRINGVFSTITLRPDNTLVVRCVDEYGRMNCSSNMPNEIAWTYDGNTEINSPCQSSSPDVFQALPHPTDNRRCDIAAWLKNATSNEHIKSISGPYGCTDRSSGGVTATALIVVLDAWCGVVNGCPVMEGSDVTVGCYGQYDWLSFWLQYNPIVSINSSIQFVNETNTLVTDNPTLVLGSPAERPPPSVNFSTSYTFQNVQRNQPISATCQIDLKFDKSTAYSGRNTYADNPLQWECAINVPVNYCPVNVTISPRDACEYGTVLNCTADSEPEAEFYWIEHHNNSNRVNGSTYPLKPGRYRVTCVAYINVPCSAGNTVCRDTNSTAEKLQRTNDPKSTHFPFSLFGFTTPDSSSSLECNARDTLDGYAIKCPNMTLEAFNGTKCDNDNVTVPGPMTVTFRCTYEIDEHSMAMFTWYRDGQLLVGVNSNIARIAIGSGHHRVTCTGMIDINTILPGRNFNNPACICNETRTIGVIVVECYNITTSPQKVCVKEGTVFSSSATGYPESPVVYSWTHWQLTPTTSVHSGTGNSHAVDGIGTHAVQFSAAFSAPSYCPSYLGYCHSNVTVRTFACPNVSLAALNGSICNMDGEVDVVLFEPSTVAFMCSYDNPPYTTMYEWYVNGSRHTGSGSSSNIAYIPISKSHTVVECRASIDIDTGCTCNDNTTINVTIVDCNDPALTPAKECVRQGEEFTCTPTSGYPGTPTTTLSYKYQGDSWSAATPSVGVSTYKLSRLGNFSLSCEAKYSHARCPQYSASCYANQSGVAFECPDNLTLTHNSSSTYYNRSIAVTFECNFETIYSHETSYEWTVNDMVVKTGSRFLEYFFENGMFNATCTASYEVLSDDCSCSRSSYVPICIELPPPPPDRYCPFPHWPPIILPIIAILLSMLMVPCYCYACGPWSGPYWAEEREKVIVYDQSDSQQLRSRPFVTGSGYNDGARMRLSIPVNTNG